MTKRHDPIAAQNVAATPHASENRRSIARQMEPPRHFRDLVRWFIEGYDLETPDAIHSSGLWVGGQERDPEKPQWPAELVGGSELGTPAADSDFRRLMENSPRETDREDDAYVRPMRAALAELRHSSPFMADALQKMANGASMEEAALGFTRDAPRLAAELIVGESLRRLYGKYRVDPEPRTIRTEKPPEAA